MLEATRGGSGETTEANLMPERFAGITTKKEFLSPNGGYEFLPLSRVLESPGPLVGSITTETHTRYSVIVDQM
ncbi:hypothetical protein N7517_004027 [Penicillium concentricum]|uniref:Uncharacterized protein n=1 Tax=Penicillium concentricum TaxID=293559 RepID=A0A9W9S4R9_9EURO|nr:uncharacterized protein N7517_004027 [Penicillium concentricum]KAJ5372021.1 hypothetical protein N7517_004027 [Penicillium concentricum]